jgi:hypothetical protein
MIVWLVPLLGVPVTIIGLVLSVKGLKSAQRGKAKLALALNAIGLVMAVANSAYGAYLGMR